MTITEKILGQAAPAATTETDLYTVPAVTSAIVSSITICNRGPTPATFRVSASAGGAATANKDYLYYDEPLVPNATFVITIGVTLGAGDKIRVYFSTANLSASAFGQEKA